MWLDWPHNEPLENDKHVSQLLFKVGAGAWSLWGQQYIVLCSQQPGIKSHL